MSWRYRPILVLTKRSRLRSPHLLVAITAASGASRDMSLCSDPKHDGPRLKAGTVLALPSSQPSGSCLSWTAKAQSAGSSSCSALGVASPCIRRKDAGRTLGENRREGGTLGKTSATDGSPRLIFATGFHRHASQFHSSRKGGIHPLQPYSCGITPSTSCNQMHPNPRLSHTA